MNQKFKVQGMDVHYIRNFQLRYLCPLKLNIKNRGF